jgi:hypothetical protein
VGYRYHPLAGLCLPFGVTKWPENGKNQHKKLFSGIYGPFLLKEWAY